MRKIAEAQASAVAPWDKDGRVPQEFVVDLKARLESVRDLLQGRSSDATMVQSAVEDTLSLMVYASSQKELHALKALIQSYIAKENANGAVDSKGAD